MSTQNTFEQEQKQGQDYKREYPLHRTVRLRKDNLVKIKARATKYGQSFDDIITEMLLELEQRK